MRGHSAKASDDRHKSTARSLKNISQKQSSKQHKNSYPLPLSDPSTLLWSRCASQTISGDEAPSNRPDSPRQEGCRDVVSIITTDRISSYRANSHVNQTVPGSHNNRNVLSCCSKIGTSKLCITSINSAQSLVFCTP
jgi:hypothetical protein